MPLIGIDEFGWSRFSSRASRTRGMPHWELRLFTPPHPYPLYGCDFDKCREPLPPAAIAQSVAALQLAEGLAAERLLGLRVAHDGAGCWCAPRACHAGVLIEDVEQCG